MLQIFDDIGGVRRNKRIFACATNSVTAPYPSSDSLWCLRDRLEKFFLKAISESLEYKRTLGFQVSVTTVAFFF